MNSITRHPNAVLRRDIEKLKTSISKLRLDLELTQKAIVIINEKIDKQMDLFGQLVEELNNTVDPDPV